MVTPQGSDCPDGQLGSGVAPGFWASAGWTAAVSRQASASRRAGEVDIFHLPESLSEEDRSLAAGVQYIFVSTCYLRRARDLLNVLQLGAETLAPAERLGWSFPARSAAVADDSAVHYNPGSCFLA